MTKVDFVSVISVCMIPCSIFCGSKQIRKFKCFRSLLLYCLFHIPSVQQTDLWAKSSLLKGVMETI